MNVELMFEKASRLKLRFGTQKGNLTTEDLWDLPLTNKIGISLDDIAKSLNRILKENEDESFVVKTKTVNIIHKLKFEIVKHIISVKLDEVESAKSALKNKDQKEKILRIIASKEDESLKEESLENLKKMAEKLD